MCGRVEYCTFNLTYNTMSNFKTRLIEEQKQLNDKVEYYENFVMSEKYDKIDTFQQTLLTIQLSIMTTYLQCLNARIKKL